MITLAMMSLTTLNIGCVASSLHAVLKQVRQDNSANQQVNKEALQQIQSLRIHFNALNQSMTFSYENNRSELLPLEIKRIKAIVSKPNLKIILHVAPASAGTSFQQIVLATKRADEVYKLVSLSSQKVDVRFAPKQAADTLRIELES
jgi:hypothetical protein